ncbi:unnamed protein product [Ectocarpus sp. 13 AM-2016]
MPPTGGAEQGLPPEYSLSHDRCIVHFDIDCFYAQVEEVLDPSLRGKPIGIRQKYLLVTCNYAARRLGVRKMESLAEATRRCPSLVVMDGEDLTRYREASEAIFSGGTLLEAQTGLEISLNVDGNTTSGSGISGVGTGEQGTDSNGNMTNRNHITASPSGGTPSAQHPGRSTPPRVTESSQLARAGRLVPTGENQGTSQDSTGSGESGRGLRNAPAPADIGSGSVGGSKQALSGPEDRDSRDGRGSGSGGTAGVVQGRGGGCRCGCHERLSAASAFAERVRKGLFEAVGYTCSAGIGCSKMTAKLAGELNKPDQQTTILPEHAMSMITQLPLRKLPGCGYSTCAKIKAELGITESRQLQGAPWPLLVKAVGIKLARVLFLLCR